ncbi:MAG TPA: dihydroxyacetone kinase subunit DhaK [Candidatus Limnocylindrales bacterium]|nr:dihydroxyacetone kinase subunit DhaK [Candidatus Limnocylindrales bacterium]
MQKILNDPERFVDEMLDGILAAHPDQLRRVGSRGIVRAGAPIAGKVAIVTGGGSGHLPVFMGYVGEGLLDGAAIGEVFASPSADQMLEVAEAVSADRGILFLYGNYGGDVMNFDMAAELAGASGLDVRTILAADDVASAPPSRADRRRGIAGIFLLFKVAGAAAAGGASLDEVVAVTERAAGGLRTMGVALSPCTIPAAGVPTFSLPEGEMEIGMGIHGEPGVRRGALEPADRIADELVDTILADRDYPAGSRVAVLVNGLGATPREELYILYRRVAQRLAERHLGVHRVWIGEYATSLEMAGASVSLMAVDDELAGLLDEPASTPFVVQAR